MKDKKEIKPKTGESNQEQKERLQQQNFNLCIDYIIYLLKKYKLKK